MRTLLMAIMLAGSLTCAASAQTPGAVVSGRPGAIWADQDHDGRVDGYTYNGHYYVGAPANSPPPMPPLNQPTNRTGERG